MSNNNAVAKTIQVYEKYGKDAMPSRYNNISAMKKYFDYFIENLLGNKVLDVGCGLGNDSKYLSEKGLDVIGIDLAKNFVKIATKNAPMAKIRQMDMRNLKFDPISFDGIWVSASFLHIPKSDAKKCLKDFYKILRSKGLLYLGVANGNGEKVLYKQEYNGIGKFYAYYTKEELCFLIERVGFKIIKAYTEKLEDNTWLNVFATKGQL